MKKSVLVFSISSILLLTSCEQSKTPLSFHVSFSNGEGYTIHGETNVTEGKDYSFTVSLLEGYEASSSYAVKANGEAVTKAGDVYTIPSVKEDLLITVEGVSKIQYSVSFTASEYVTFSGEKNVYYGADYSFSCQVAEGYSYTSIAVKENGVAKAVEEKDGVFNVRNIKGDLVITAEGVAHDAVLVNKDFAADHYVFEGESEVAYGEDYSFKISFAPGYQKGSNFSFLLNDEVTSFEDGKTYTVPHVTAPVHIELSGEEVIVNHVEFVCDIPEAIKNEADSLPYFAETFSFSLILDERYSDCEEKLKVYSLIDEVKTPLEKAADGTYTLANPKKNFQILVEGAAINQRTVSFYNGETKVYEVTVPIGTALSETDLNQAKAAFVASLGEGQRFVKWDQELTDIEDNITVHGVVENRISSEEELKAMASDGHYYLANDIEIVKTDSGDPLNLAAFSGSLDGNGHRIYAKKGIRDGWDTKQKGLLFSSLNGTVKNLEVEYMTGWVHTSVSGIAGTMEGGLIENVTVRLILGAFSWGNMGAIVGTVNGGTIQNCNVYYAAEDYDSTKEDYAPASPIVNKLNEGGTVQNVVVHLPMPVDASKLSLARTGAERLVNCSVVKDETKLYDSALATPVTTEQTFLGMPVSKMDVSNGVGGKLFTADILTKKDGVTSLSFYCHVENYLKDGTNNEDTMAISSDGAFRLPSTTNNTFWTYVEVRYLDSGIFLRVCPLINKANSQGLNFLPSNSGYYEKFEFGLLYTWNAASTATVYTTPVYCH